MKASKKLIAALVIAPVMALASASSGVTQNVWRISLDQARCIQDNADAYRNIGRDPIVIVVQSCPEADLVAAVQALTENSGLFGTQNGDDIIVMTSEELACFQQIELNESLDGLIEIDKDKPCE